jgi:hypothetical protein
MMRVQLSAPMSAAKITKKVERQKDTFLSGITANG